MKNKKLISLLAITAMSVSLIAGCGNNNTGDTNPANDFEGSPIVSVDEDGDTTTPQPDTAEPAGLEVPEGCYLSELTGLPISNDLKNQRPIALMVDCEKESLPNFEIAECDIVYELMNSTANDRVTRLMCIRKD